MLYIFVSIISIPFFFNNFCVFAEYFYFFFSFDSRECANECWNTFMRIALKLWSGNSIWLNFVLLFIDFLFLFKLWYYWLLVWWLVVYRILEFFVCYVRRLQVLSKSSILADNQCLELVCGYWPTLEWSVFNDRFIFGDFSAVWFI